MIQRIKAVFKKCWSWLWRMLGHVAAYGCYLMKFIIGGKRALYLTCNTGCCMGRLERGDFFYALITWLPKKQYIAIKRWYDIKRGWITIMPWDKEYKGEDKVYRSEIDNHDWVGKKESKE